MEEQGATLKEIEIAELEEVRLAQIIAILGEFRTTLKEDFAEHARELVGVLNRRKKYTLDHKYWNTGVMLAIP